MSNLTQKANGAKTVTSGTATTTATANTKNEQTPIKNELQEAKERMAEILKTPTAEQRIKNAEIFTKIADKFQFLKKKQDHLNSFMASRDGLKEKMFIVSDNEENFEISNTVIVEKILILCQGELEYLVKQSETEVSTFTI